MMRKILLLISIFTLFFASCQQREVTQVKSDSLSVEAHFSPRGGCTEAIVENVLKAKKFVHVAIYSFTSKKIARALVKVHQKGIEVLVVADRGASRGRNCVLPILERYGIPVRYKKGSGGGLMHNKYAIIDGKVVITGSFNWTKSAEYRNDENLVVIKSRELAKVYEKNFEKLWNLAELEN